MKPCGENCTASLVYFGTIFVVYYSVIKIQSYGKEKE